MLLAVLAAFLAPLLPIGAGLLRRLCRGHARALLVPILLPCLRLRALLLARLRLRT